MASNRVGRIKAVASGRALADADDHLNTYEHDVLYYHGHSHPDYHSIESDHTNMVDEFYLEHFDRLNDRFAAHRSVVAHQASQTQDVGGPSLAQRLRPSDYARPNTKGFQWYGPQVIVATREILGNRIKAAGIYLRDKIKLKIGRTQPVRNGWGLNPSKPGEYPKIVTSWLRTGIEAEYDDGILTSRVGTNVPYGRDLQLGRHDLAPRPWLSMAIAEFTPALKNIIGSGHP